jgi:hypothetical protein
VSAGWAQGGRGEGEGGGRTRDGSGLPARPLSMPGRYSPAGPSLRRPWPGASPDLPKDERTTRPPNPHSQLCARVAGATPASPARLVTLTRLGAGARPRCSAPPRAGDGDSRALLTLPSAAVPAPRLPVPVARAGAGPGWGGQSGRAGPQER